MANRDGLKQGEYLEIAVSGAWQDGDPVRENAINPADGRGGRSANIPLIEAATAAVRGKKWADDWWEREARRRLDEGPLFSGEDSIGGQYSGFSLAAVSAAWRGLVPPACDEVLRLYDTMLASQLLGFVPWAGAEHCVPAVGERVQEHYYTPVSLMAWRAAGRQVPDKFLSRLPDPRLLLTDEAPHGRYWPYRVERMTVPVRPLWAKNLAEGRMTDDAREVVGSIRFRHPWSVYAWERARLVICWEWSNCESTACAAALSIWGQGTQFLCADRYLRGDGGRYRGSKEIAPGSAWPQSFECEHDDDAGGVLDLAAESSAPRAGEFARRSARINTNLDGCGRLLYRVTWPGGNATPEIYIPGAQPEPMPKPADPPALTLEERVAALEAWRKEVGHGLR